MARRAKDDLSEAGEILSRVEQNLDSYENKNEVLKNNYRMAKIRYNLVIGEYNRAFRLIKGKRNWRKNMKYQLLYAEYLLKTGRKSQAKRILEGLKEKDNYPRRVEKLLEDMN
jgi:thioredoxin-like negative regulator of GroEL